MPYSRILAALLSLCALPASAFAQTSSYPDGYVIWQSNRQDSRTEAYRARADGSEVTRLTFGGANRPQWSPDGRWISYMDPSDTIFVMRPDGSELKSLAVGWQINWMHDNSGLLVSESTGDFNVYDPETGESTRVFSQNDFPQFAGTTFQVNAMTADNRYVLLGSHLYINGYTGSNGSFTSEYSALALDLLHKEKVYFVGSGCWPFSSPMGDLVFHICATSTSHPDIYHLHLADLDTRSSYAAEVAHEDADWGHEYNPRVSNDNRWIAYMASAGCHQGDDCDYDIWLHAIGSDPSQRLRVTQDPSFDGYPEIHIGPLWQASAAPRLLVTPNRLTFFASASALPAPQLLKLKNTGGGALGAATIATDPPVGWLDVVQGASGFGVGLRAGAAITRGTQCTNLTITVAGAAGSPVTVPVTLVADESFPLPEAVDAGVGTDVALTLDAGFSVDAGQTDGTVRLDGPAGEARPIVAVDAAALDCDALLGREDAGSNDGGVIAPPPKTGDSGCGCTLGGTSRASGLLAYGLVVLALLARRRGRRRRM